MPIFKISFVRDENQTRTWRFLYVDTDHPVSMFNGDQTSEEVSRHMQEFLDGDASRAGRKETVLKVQLDTEARSDGRPHWGEHESDDGIIWKLKVKALKDKTL